MKKYIKGLKEHRERKAKAMLVNVFESSNLDINAHGKPFLDDIIKNIIPLQNRTRGSIFEVMAEVIIGNTFGITDFDKQVSFVTPYGVRRIDLFSKNQAVAIEIKSGFARLNSATRAQVRKDISILNNEDSVDRVVWFCFRGATKPLIKHLTESQIEYVDLEYDKLDCDVEGEPKTIIMEAHS
ncbi:hypothetical protein KIH87_11115 [Paraneptunicella aestuarii]|uniref:hypothetical protein n=1 Tax=Paraneptunicella aestuarii TaxID=2831148 RepID=UPI001E447DD8|nr:hypothetical protein [Paraneptunicella aestuarii]UAA37286.1 hypothetical protein KIH87_11115 [Paraneptunicella aestuarii]